MSQSMQVIVDNDNIRVVSAGEQGPASLAPGSLITSDGDLIIGSGVGAATVIPKGNVGQELTRPYGANRAAWRDKTVFDVRDYGAVGDNTTDDLTALQAAFTDAFAVGGTVELPHDGYVISEALTLPDNTAGTIRIVGTGRPRSFTGGVNGDLDATAGTEIRTTSTTDSVFHSVNNSGGTKVHITLENLAIIGNVATGTTGHGLHFEAASSTNSTIVALRDVSIIGCTQHGIFADGNVFEAQAYNMRSSLNGGDGFRAAARGGGIPGEWRFYGVSIFQNLTAGMNLAGGGGYAFFGVSLTDNAAEGLTADGVTIKALDLNLEINGPLAGNQMLLSNMGASQFSGLSMNVAASSTGAGVKTEGSTGITFAGITTNSSGSGSGYADFEFDFASSRMSVVDYFPDDGVNRIEYGSYGGHVVRQGGRFFTAAAPSISTQTTSGSADVTPNGNLVNEHQVTVTGAGGPTLFIHGASMNAAFNDGQRLTYEIFNNSAGAVTCSWDSIYHLAGAWVDPAAGKTRRIEFVWNNNRACFVEQSRSGEIT